MTIYQMPFTNKTGFHHTSITKEQHTSMNFVNYLYGVKGLQNDPSTITTSHPKQFFFCVMVKEGGVQELKIDITEACADVGHDILQISQKSAYRFHTTAFTLSIIYASA